MVLLAACQSDATTSTSCDGGTDGGGCLSVGMLTCSAPMQDCRNGAVDGCETNIATDTANCGSCANKCSDVSNGTPACTDGACGVGSCAAPYLDCNLALADGCEANSSRDPEHCGDCNTRCPTAKNATPACSGGKCRIACNAPFLDCNNDPQDGCEINTATDINNCGSCGNKCPAGPNGQPACANGTCILTQCTAPYLTCTAGPADSCETNTSNDVNNCAGCGNKCPAVAHGTPGCSSGACGIGSCSGTYTDCNNSPTDGCEVDTSTDPLHCGSCAGRCNLPNASPGCANGACTVASCVGTYKDCDSLPANGCEVNTANDPNNCNACGNKCPVPANAMGAFCTVGVCKFTCLPGFADCDGNPANGCEVNLNTDVNNCTACGNQCGLKPNTVGSSCAGRCQYVCSAGYADCNGNPGDGCEIQTANDMRNCGACGAVCSIANGTGTCSGSMCRVLSCAAPFRDCDGSAGDGCEVNSSNDPRNCGACNNVCPTRPNTSNTLCVGSGCTFTCSFGRANCNGNPVDGCETDTTGDSSNCGTCGHSCGFLDWCVNSRCCTFGVFC